MKTIKFSGHSDDVLVVEGMSEAGDEYYLPTNGPIVLDLVHECSDGILPMKLTAGYITPGMWMIGLAPFDEDIPMPHWRTRWSFDGYTAVLEIDVPSDKFSITDVSRDH